MHLAQGWARNNDHFNEGEKGYDQEEEDVGEEDDEFLIEFEDEHIEAIICDRNAFKRDNDELPTIGSEERGRNSKYILTLSGENQSPVSKKQGHEEDEANAQL